jgi:hypothetical protein
MATSPVTALFRHRDLLRRAGEGAKLSITCTADSQSAYVAVKRASPGQLAQIQKAFARTIPKVKPTWNGVQFPFIDLRGRRAEAYLTRISEALPRQGRGRGMAPSVLVMGVVERLFLGGKDEDVEKLIVVLGGDPAPPQKADASVKKRALEELLATLVKRRRLIRFKAAKPSATETHLRGPAYVEAAEAWPTEDGEPLALFMQIRRGGFIALPKGVELLQIFSSGTSLRVKTCARLRPKHEVRRPDVKTKAFALVAVEDGSVPDYDELPKIAAGKRIVKLCEAINPLVPRDAYVAASARFMKHPDAWSFAGGWPRWLEEPAGKRGIEWELTSG